MDFGLYKQIFLIVNLSVTLLPFGFAMSAYYFLPREPLRNRQVIFNVAFFYLIVGLATCLVLFLHPALLAAIFGSPELTDYGRVVGLLVFFWLISSFFETVAVAHGEAFLAAVFVAATHFSKALLLLAAAFAVPTLGALIYAALAHGVLQTAALVVYLSSRFPGFWHSPDWALMRSQIAYAVPLGAAALLWLTQTELHHFVVSHRFGPAAERVEPLARPVPLRVVADELRLIRARMNPLDPWPPLRRVPRTCRADDEHGRAIAPRVEYRHRRVHEPDVRMQRGGHFANRASLNRSGIQYSDPPGTRNPLYGFRVSRTISTP